MDNIYSAKFHVLLFYIYILHLDVDTSHCFHKKHILIIDDC